MKAKTFFLCVLVAFCFGTTVAFSATIDLSGSLINYTNQGSSGSASYDSMSQTLTLTGDTWKAIDISSVLATGATTLTFDFMSSLQGEIHAIGFDSNTSWSSSDSGNFFQLYGTQPTSTWNPNTSFAGQYTTLSEWKTYSIDLTSLAGSLNYLVLVNDNDAGAKKVVSAYKNFSAVTPVPVPAAVWMLGTGLVAVLGVRRKMAA